MGRFVNPDNSAFQVALNSDIYIDKTGLLEYTNHAMNTDRALICNSRPRRFGKSVTANMLVAYDVLIRDEASNAVQEEYINFLRGMFKGSEPIRFIQLAYLTGILPIKKVKTQSALNNFDEFTMLDARVFAPYIGFTEDEVQWLCKKYNRDFDEVKRWYDGYLLEGCQVYNPKAVVGVMTWNKFQSYWSQTGTYESIVPLINMDFDGLKNAVITMLSGGSVKVKTKSYQNDMITFKNKDDVLTAMIHLGYLGYDQKDQTAFIPNEEIRSEFIDVVEENKWNDFLDFKRESDNLLEATLDMDEEAVAEGIERVIEKLEKKSGS